MTPEADFTLKKNGGQQTAYFSNGPGSGVWEFLQFRFFFFSWSFASDCDPGG